MDSRGRLALIGSGLWKMRLFLLVAGGIFVGIVVLMVEPKDAETVVHPSVATAKVASAKVASAKVATMAPVQAEETRLEAGVGFDGETFVGANLMDFDVYDATVELEPGVLSTGWTAAAARIRKKDGAGIAAGRFQKSNGVRFNPERDEASYARVTARDKAGVVYRSRTIAIKALR